MAEGIYHTGQKIEQSGILLSLIRSTIVIAVHIVKREKRENDWERTRYREKKLITLMLEAN